MTTSNERVQEIATADRHTSAASENQLQHNALGWKGIFFACAACVAPMAALFFNVPGMAAQAGAAVPLVFVISAIGLLALGITLVYFSRRLTSAAGFISWVRHGLGTGAAFQTGWLLAGAYAIFEAAATAAFGGLADLNLSTYFNIHAPGGWVFYAIVCLVIVSLLAFFDVQWSIYVMAPFAIAEILTLVILDIAITAKGGASGHDLLHTFTPAGANLKGVAPGGLLGIGIAMALGLWSCTGFESGAVYGEEAKNPRRAIPVAIFSVLALMAVLYIWTSYSALIGLGWQHAGDTLGNIMIAPEPYYRLADTYVGSWLRILMIVFVSTSTFVSCLAFRNAMTRYVYSMAREGAIWKPLSRTHPRWKSPYIASHLQTVFVFLAMLFLALVLQKSNADGSTSYAFGIADGKIYQQTNGIASYQWLAIIGTICLLVVYIMTNIAAPRFARQRNELHIVTHVLAPIISTLAFLIPLISFIMPPLPGIGSFFTGLGFSPTPFPLNILPLFVILWVIIGTVSFLAGRRKHPARYEQLGTIVNDDELVAAPGPAVMAASGAADTPVLPSND